MSVTFKRCALAMSVLLAGCSLTPTLERPEAPIPVQWPAVPGAAGQAVGAPTVATLAWQDFVVDARLRALIDLSLRNNRDLRQAWLNVEAARTQYSVQRADRLPGINADAGATRQRVPADQSTTGQASTQSSYQANIGLAAFELDVFGRVRALSDAALEEFLSTEAATQSTHITLVSEVIQAYLTREGAQRRHRLTEQTLASREASLNLISRRRQAGTATALDQQEAQGLTEQARVSLARTEREIRQSTYALGLLVGVSDIEAQLASYPASDLLLVQDIAAGTPSDLLEQRPDIRSAEHQLRARNANIGAARAAFFPRISLTGLFGTSSTELSSLFGSGQLAWSFMPQVTLPIFDGGRNQANLDLATIRKDSAVAGYEKAVQTAFREVADALAATDTLRREEAAQRALVASSQETLRLSQARYRAGVDDHLRYLDAQRNDFVNQTSLIDIGTQRQMALASLFRSLGGGWQSASPQVN
ncbi:efflux transporter outer membrane subunit [Pigmentiphaga aceris]|uniref:Efflux transporter outer membrane subunit n=1 Tax=Pigmentiphaga aceris TaxID=1940612 RepID=A0A5C0AZ36_9BURK|nr:efflux transporter outer membrane subunit [Pigmentiphaga aceris]QEI05697.1 efflux transporter outer membrane subunit [Pigmentiphaga aceris]